MTQVHPWVASLLESDLSNGSKEQYIRQLNKLHDLAGGRSLETIIAHPGEMKTRIDKAFDNHQSRKALLSAIRALFKYNEHLKEEYASEYEAWTHFAQETDKTIFDRVSTAQPTQRELLNWVPWAEIVRKQQEMSATEYGSFEHVVLSMYTLMEPMRADFGQLRLYFEGRDAVPTEKSDDNYIIISPQPGHSRIILNTYKTSRKYGAFQRIIPDELVHVIVKSVHLTPREYLFTDETGNPYSKRNTYTKMVNRILERLFKKRLTISLLRHAFISGIDFNESTPGQLMQYSKNMMHSMGMQQLYRRKIPEIKVITREERRSRMRVPKPPVHSSETNAGEDAGDGRVILI